jgi:PAS domain S-box-containing protein
MAFAVALLLVGAVAALKHVSGLTVFNASFTMYLLVIAFVSARSGYAPGLVATLAVALVSYYGIDGTAETAGQVWFLVEAIGIVAVVGTTSSRLAQTKAQLAAARGSIRDLQGRDRRGRLVDAAMRHLESVNSETAVVIVNERGHIAEWRDSAERLYGYTAEQAIGSPGAMLFAGVPTAPEFADLLAEARLTGCLRRLVAHSRNDGTRLNVEMEIKPSAELDAPGFTLTATNLARRREWDAYREAAARAQAALQQAADEARHQLAALETLTDPSLNPLAGTATVAELLERLRTTIDADAVALVRNGRVRSELLAALGLAPYGVASLEKPLPTAGRVIMIHNDTGRVAQVSALRWPSTVASLMIVPVIYNGEVCSTIEVASERSRRSTDFDVALVRITADRLAGVVAQNPRRASGIAV